MKRILEYSGYPLFTLVVLYGMFYRITSSEFWPITISRTWLHPDRFEFSMLQKPLLTFILSFFHIFQLNDVTHLLFVKLAFSLTAAVGLYYYFNLIHKWTQPKKEASPNSLMLCCVFLVLSSFSLQENFFSIRSDQIACSLFIFFLYFCESAKPFRALITLSIIPLFGIKESIFLLPGFSYFMWMYGRRLSKTWLFYGAGFSLSVIVWIIALNVDAFIYLYETYQGISLYERYAYTHFKFELPLIALSWASAFYLVYKNRTLYLKQILLCICFSLYLALIPQAYNFFMASVIVFIYIPLLLCLKSIWPHFRRTLLILIILLIAIVQISKHNMKIELYSSITPQLTFINRASKLIHQNKLSYLDGVGVLPRQNFIPCFVSPFDDTANFSCLNTIEQNPEVIIITSRLASLGKPIWKAVEKNYTQVLPNTWVHKNNVNQSVLEATELSKLPLPIFEFR